MPGSEDAAAGLLDEYLAAQPGRAESAARLAQIAMAHAVAEECALVGSASGSLAHS